MSLGFRFLILSAIDILGWIICCIVVDCCGNCSIFSGIPGLYPLPINGNYISVPSQLCQPEVFPDIVKCLLGENCPLLKTLSRIGSYSGNECRCPHIGTVLPFLFSGYIVSCLWLLDKKEKWGKSGGDKLKIAPSFLFCSNFILFGLNLLEQYSWIIYADFVNSVSATD